jgi:tetratricopeptide (TPR) repeat protein
MGYNLTRFLLVPSFLFIFLNHTFAQETTNLKEMFLEAESNFLYEEYLEALPIYSKLKDEFPDNYNLDYKIGRCYLNIPFERQKATAYLERAAQHTSITYKNETLKETQAPLDALFYLGDAYRINNQLNKAIEIYNDFKKKASETVYDIQLVDHQIKACQRAIELMKKPVEVTETNLGATINTRFSETNPVISEDETILVYASKLPFYQAMFYSKKVDGKWTAPINMIPELGIDGDCFPTSLSSDGTELYLYRSNEFQGDLYVTNFKNGQWTKIRKLNDNINTKYWESHACISHDGKTLYFTSNRKGGYGGLDIYKSERTAGDNWGPPQNLGAVINTSYNEETPFITADGKRLYFSSFGHETIGGYDIFYSDLNSDGTWSQPVNLGYPINSTDDDIFFNPLKDGAIAYIAKYDPKGYGRDDLFRLEIVSREKLPSYLISCNVRIPQNWSDIKYIYMAVFDLDKKDTILRKFIDKEKFSFETTSRNIELHLKGQGYQPQVITINIPKGSQEKERNILAFMAFQETVPVLSASYTQSGANKDNAAIVINNRTNSVTKEENAIAKSKVQATDSNSVQIKLPGLKDTTVLKNNSVIPVVSVFPMLSVLLYSGLIIVLLILIFIFFKKRRRTNKKD